MLTLPSGQVKTTETLNYEAASTYAVAFTASDPQSNSASIALTITVTDIDTEAPGRTCEAVHRAESRQWTRSVEGRVDRS